MQSWYLSGHDNAGSARVDSHISSHQAYVLELLLHLTILLVAECLTPTFTNTQIKCSICINSQLGGIVMEVSLKMCARK